MDLPRRTRAADVAELAGVSTATVSYVLNNTPGQKVSKATATRVRNAADQLGYVTNPAAQALARGSSNLVLLDMSDFITQSSASMAAGPILKSLRKLGYEPFMTWWPDGLEGFSREDRVVSFSRATSPLAVISVFPMPGKLQEKLRSLGVRSISSAVETPEDLVPALALPVFTQVSYLVDQGHTHVFYAASNKPSLDDLVKVRAEIGAKAAQSHRISWTELPRYTDVPELAHDIRAAMDAHPEATAIAAYNDADALTVLFALHELRVDIPGRMAVMGIDNEDFAELTHPKLTSIAFGFDTEVIDPDVFLKAIEGRGEAGFLKDYHLMAIPELHVRESA